VKRSDGFQRTLDELQRIPASPRSLAGPKNWLNGVLLFSDYLASVPPAMARLTTPLRKYPKDFTKVRIESLDGTRLTGWFGRSPRPGPQPGLVLLPGLFTSKDNNRIRARSIRILREWGFHILTLDLRGIGESERVYSTPGAKEADDIVAALRWLAAQADVKPVHLYSESLAAAAALVAVGREGREGRPLVDGRILSVSPFSDPEPIVRRFSGPLDWRDRNLAGAKAFFKFVLRLGGTGETEFDQYVTNGARHYGIPLETMYARSRAGDVIAHARSETLILHSEDDSIVPVQSARELEERAHDNPQVAVRILPWGNHCLYEMAEPDWYWATLARFFEARPQPTP
jgi:pimeloyl-ACP methyl ester carboxylesterase